MELAQDLRKHVKVWIPKVLLHKVQLLTVERFDNQPIGSHPHFATDWQ